MPRKYSQRSKDNLKGVHPDLRRVVDRALQESPLDFVVVEGLRTRERQQQLVDAGASKTMNSRHLTGHAVDLLPIGPDGKAAFAWPLYDRLGPAVKAAAQKEGVPVVWGGDWSTFKDGPHFELDREVYPPEKWSANTPAPKNPSRIDDKESAAPAVGIGLSGAVAVVIDAIPGTSALMGNLAPVAQTVAVVAAALCVAYILWRRSRQ